MNKKLLCICSGGFGNRIRPLSACHKIANLTGRDLLVWWIKDHRCGVDFNELFENEFEFVNEDFVDSIKKSAKIYIHSIDAVKLSSEIIGIPLMIDVCNRFPKTHVNKMRASAINDQEDVLIVFTDNFMGYENEDRDFLFGLRPQKEILDKISFSANSMNLSDRVVGVHARGSDFPTGVDFYIDKMNQIYSKNPNTIFYITSDDLEYEESIKRSFPKEKILVRSGKFYAKKKDESKDYRHNVLISRDAMMDGIVEMYLLSKTNLLVGHPKSTYFQICKILSKKEKENIPPLSMPESLKDQYTMNGQIRTSNRYFNEAKTIKKNWSKEYIDRFVAVAKAKRPGNYGNLDLMLYDLLDKFPIRNRSVLITGSFKPFYEGLCINTMSQSAVTIEFHMFMSMTLGIESLMLCYQFLHLNMMDWEDTETILILMET